MGFEELLRGEISKKKQVIKKSQKGRKYVKAVDIEDEELREKRQIEESEIRKKRHKKLLKSRRAVKKKEGEENVNSTFVSYYGVTKAKEKSEELLNAEIGLRKLKEPIRRYGESDNDVIERYERLDGGVNAAIGKNMDKSEVGSEDREDKSKESEKSEDQSDKNEKCVKSAKNEEREDENAKSEDRNDKNEDREDRSENNNITADQNTVLGLSKENKVNGECERSDENTKESNEASLDEHGEPKISNKIGVKIEKNDITTDLHRVTMVCREYIKSVLRQWEESNKSIESKEEQNKQDALLLETKRWLIPLLVKIKRDELDHDLSITLSTTLYNLQNRNYLEAEKSYMELSVGNVAWPIGVAAVSIHSRAAQARINGESGGISNIMKDEKMRRWILAVKRIMSFVQRSEKLPLYQK